MNRIFGRVTRNADRDDDRNDRRNRRLNRMGRIFGRVTRNADRDDEQSDRRERRLNRFSRFRNRVTREANPQQTPASTSVASDQPNTRFLGLPGIPGIKNPFCRDECFNDFDCPGNLKCCSDSGDCRNCVNPAF